jgi:hypothetical protein
MDPKHLHEEYSRERDMDAFWEAAVPTDEPSRRRWYLPAVIALLVLGAPWYWTPGEEGPAFAGLPVWVWISIASSLALSILTAIAAICFWRDDETD